MDELEQIQAINVEVAKLHEKIKDQMLSVVKKLGDEVVSTCGRTYRATENTGVNCVIEEFTIENETLMVCANFDGDRHTLTLDSFNASDLATTLYLMISDNKAHLIRKINHRFESFVKENGCEPTYASCCVRYGNDTAVADVIIKLNTELDNNDDAIIHYCSSLSDLNSLTTFGVEDFIVTDIYELSSTI